ncbi:restriction endonuclease subunit S [Streptomyces eurythermus]|uniref:restriction endonuclease subunit S n=1 Tax=Streptomyces eurythermus TaxID=42237 RepID=UPI0036F7D527
MTIPLKYVAHISAGQSPPSAEVTELVDGLAFLQGNAEFQAVHPAPRLECNSAPKQARKQDVLVSVRAPVGALNIADRRYGIGRGLCAIRAHRCDERFLWWWLHSQRPRLDAVSTGTTYKAVTAEDLGHLPFPSLSMDQQRRIADFLDAEAVHIDALSQRFRRLADLAQERVRAVVDTAFAEYEVGSRVPVSAVCRAIVDCVNKTAPLSAEPTPYKMIRTSNIRNGEVDLTDAFSVEKAVFTEWNRRGAPRPGDILFTREAPLGQVGMLRSNEKVFLGQRIMLYRADESRIRKELLLFNFLGSHMNRQLRLLGAGSLHEHMRVGDGLKLQVFCPPPDQQDALITRIQEGRDDSLRLSSLAQRQLALLGERRQALITAAVTGQFDVTTASGRNVTEGVSA